MTAADPNSQRLGETVFRHMEQMERMLDGLVDLSLLEQGHLQLTHASVELLRVLESAVEQCRPALESKRQRLVLDMPEQTLQIAGDEPRLVQILRTLLDNAVKFTPEGGSIHLAIEAVDSQVQIEVQDTGCGLTPTALSRVFEPFVSDTSTDGGLGLSLCITRRLVELHEGTVTASSAGPGQGSQFCVRLPLASPAD
jgi:signal transduction histidine kinase